MRGIIWYDDWHNGQKKLEEVKKEYFKNEIRTVSEIYQGNGSMIVHFDNGDTFHLKNAYGLYPGSRCNVSYIESTIPRDIVMHIIKPCAYSTPFLEYKEYTF